MYTYGLLLWQLTTGKKPFADLNIEAVATKVMQGSDSHFDCKPVVDVADVPTNNEVPQR
jgi:hypothetical protein